MANETPQLSESEKKKEDWMNSKWRPMMGWMYMVVCTMDMVVFPILWSLLQTFTHTQITQWNPLTLQGAGLFHIAMGAVLGIAAFGRTQEKLNGANNGGLSQPNLGTTYVPPTPIPGGTNNGNSAAPTTGFGTGTSAFGAPSAGGFGNTGGFGSPAPGTTVAPVPSWGTTPIASTPAVVTGFGGKPAPAPQQDPLL